MAKTEIRLDSAGIVEVLNSAPVASVVNGLAQSVAGAVVGMLPAGTDVVVDDYRTDRAASSVTIRDASGRLWQARDGVLTRAASGVGLQVKTKRSLPSGVEDLGGGRVRYTTKAGVRRTATWAQFEHWTRGGWSG